MEIVYNDTEPKYFDLLQKLVFEPYTKSGYGTRQATLRKATVGKYGISMEFENRTYSDYGDNYAYNEITSGFFNTLENWCALNGFFLDYVKSESRNVYSTNISAYVRYAETD